MAITPVQSATGGTSGRFATTVPVTMGSTPIAGNQIVLCVGGINNTNSVSSITSTNITWTRLIQNQSATSGQFLEVWIGVVAASAGTSITANISSGSGSAVAIEYSGLVASGWLDQSGTNGVSAGSSPFSTGTSATTTNASDLMLNVWFTQDADAATPSMTFSSYSNGYAAVAQANGGFTFSGLTSRYFTQVASKVVSSTGTAGGTAAVTSSTGATTWNYTGIAVALKGLPTRRRDCGGTFEV